MDKKKGQLRQTMLHRGMGILLAAVMALNTLLTGGFPASASETVSSKEDMKTGLCQHHLGHTVDCGYGEESSCAYKCPLCPIEKLIAALPGEVSEDNAEQLRAQLNEILLRYNKLTEKEQEQLDMTRCLKLQEQLKGSMVAEESEKDDSPSSEEPESVTPEGTEGVIPEGSESVIPEEAESADAEGAESADAEGAESADEGEVQSADAEESDSTSIEETESAAPEGTESANPEEPESADAEETESADAEEPESADAGEPESADPKEAEGKEPEESELCAHHPAHNDSCGYGEENSCAYACRLCPIEGLIAALPDAVTEDNGEQLRAQLEAIQMLYSELTEEEQEQLDMTRCLELQVQLSGISPSPLAMESVPYRIGGTEYSCDTYTEVRSDTSTWTTGWYVVNESVTIGSRVTVSGNVNLILADGCELKASQGINLSSGNSLTVYAQSGGTGRLTATATNTEHAGIGGSYKGSGGTVIINGGTVNATGGTYAAGIGGGEGGSGGTVTINGGAVTATGDWGAGIGGGYNGSGGSVTINGGTVSATGKNATGIGPGYSSSGGTATVTGGAVTAQGYNGAIGGDSAIIGGTFNGSKYYAVSFVTGKEDVSVPKQGVKEGSKAAEPGNIVTEGWEVSWYKDEACTEPFDFENTGITGNITLYAKWEESTDYIAEVTIDGENKKYTTLAAAWASLENKTGTMKLLQNVTTSTTLTVSSGMNVTVTMEDGVSFTNTGADCFKVDGGTLTLARGTVIENGSSKSVVYAASGGLYVSGGSYTSSNGNVLYIDENVTVQLSGGTFRASGNALRYKSHTVKDMLAEGVDLFDGNGKIVTKLDGETLAGGPYRVGTCDHEEGWVNNGDGTHSWACTKCGYFAEGTQKQNHSFNDSGECSDCGAKAAALVTVGDESSFYEGFNSAWDSLEKKTGTIKLLGNVTTATTLTVSSGTDVTVTMAEGVTFTNNSADCFEVRGGTLTLAGGTVKEGALGKSVVYAASGELYVTGGTYISGGNGLWIDSGVTVILSGGSFTASGTALRYKDHTVQEMLAESCSIYDSKNQEVSLGDSGELTGSGKTYWVISCAHSSCSYATNGDNTHAATCNACGMVIEEKEPHSYNGNGECSACGAVAAAQVRIGEDSAFYEDFASAWDSLKDQTGTIKLLQNVTTSTTLTVSSGTDVTVIMADGVSFTNTGADCFKVDGGTLTLAGGKVVGASDKYIVNASSGAIHVTGGSYESSGHGLVIESGATATLSGGSFTVSGTALLYLNHTVEDMLAEDYFLFGSDNQIISCDENTLIHGEPFTVAKCPHPELVYESINLNEHKGTCTICNKEIISEHSWEDGSCTECGAKVVAQVDWGNGYISSYPSVEDAWNAARGQTATITLLENAVVSGLLELPGGSNITLKMAEGVSLSKALDSEGSSDLIYFNGGSLTLVSGTVQNNREGGTALWVWNGNLTISGGRVIANGEGGCGILAYQNSNITISGGSVEAKDRALDVASFGELKISGGSITSEKTALLIRSTKATITGGTFSGGKVTLGKTWYEDDPEPPLLPEGYGLKLENGWKTDGYEGALNLTGPISVKQIPFTMDTEEVEEQWYYGTEKTLTVEAQLNISGAEPSYAWKNGEEILDCTQSEYTVPATTSAGSYSYICEVTYDGYTLSKKFSAQILKSGTELESLIVSNGRTQTDTFFIDETVTVIARLRATGQAPEKRMRGGYTAPTAGQMALYIGESQVSPAVDAGEDGTYTMSVSAAYAAEVAGGLGEATLTARAVGSDSMDAAEASAEITVIAAAKAERSGEVLAYYGAGNLAQAFAAENSGATVSLLADVKITEALTIGEGSNITFDGGAFTLSSTDGNVCAFQVAPGGALNIIGGKISAAGTGVEVYDGRLNISGGEITAQNDGVAISGGELNISGGTIHAKYDSSVNASGGSTVTITDGTVTGYCGVYAQEGSTVTISGGTITVRIEGVVAENEGSTVTISGGTITAENGIGVGAGDGGTVTITDGTVTAENGIGVSAGDGGTVTITDGTVTGDYYGVYAQEGSTVTINGGTITAKQVGIASVGDSTATISGGTITAAQIGAGVAMGGTLNITDGTITAEEIGVYAFGSSTVKMSGGTFTGNVQGAIFAGEDGEEGEKAGRIGDMLPNYGQATGPYYALYKEGQSVAAEAYKGASLPAGTYTVKECSHAETVHYEPVSDETHNKTCTDCDFGGNVITESHHFVLSAKANGVSIALTQKCSECGYEYFGEARFQIPELVYGETLNQKIQWEGQSLEKFTMLRLGLDEYQLLELPENPLLVSKLTGGKQLTAGAHTLKIVECLENRVVCSIPLTVAPAKLTEDMVTLSQEQGIYTGAEQKPNLTVRKGATELTEGTDYEISYSGDFTNAGTGKITVSGKGNFAGSVEKTYTIAQAELTVTANDQSITHGEQIRQGTGSVTADGICSGDSLDSVILTASTEDVPGGAITPSAAVVKNSGGLDVTGNYRITYVSGKLTISKEEGTLKVPETTIRKTFGDGEFNLNCSTNGHGKIFYGSSNEDIASVSADGTVLIKGAGEVTITVSLAADGDHTGGASREITLSVAKAAAPERVEETREYSYSIGTDGAITVDVTGMLPKDRGETKYTVTSADEQGILADVSVDEDGNLSYTVPGNHAAGDMASITVTAQMANYESATYTVTIDLVNKKVVGPLSGSSVSIKDSNILIYGQTLSELTLEDTIFVEKGTYNEVKGTLAWKAPSNVPAVTARVAEWVFTPEDKDEYAVLTGTVAINVVKATPKVESPTAAGVTYDPSLTLGRVELRGGSATWTVGGSPITVKGTWNWKDASTVPTVGGSGYSAVFMPADTRNFNTVECTVAVPVAQARPYIAAVPRAAQITYGTALDAAILTGGTVQHSSANNTLVTGGFAWKDGSIKPTVADSGSREFAAVFTPADTTNYSSVECSVTLTVEKAENAPNMPSAAMNVAKSCEKLSDVVLPKDWQWQNTDQDTALGIGVPVAATAVYVGADKDNYQNVSITVTVTRAGCAHSRTELRSVAASTCQKKGYSGDRYCLDCGELVQKGTQTNLAAHSGGTATCISGKICVVCKAEYTGKDSTNHLHAEIRGAVKASCGVDGHTGDTYCTDCHAKIASGRVIQAKGHNWHTVSENAPSIKAEGRRIYVCFRCGQNREEIIPKLPQSSHTHRYREKETKAASCTEGGLITYSCGCGDAYVKNTEALGHSYESKITKPASTAQAGVKTFTCKRCGDSYTEPIERLEETPTEAPTEVPTEAPTEVATEAPTEVATEAPTEVPTEAPTEVPTEAQTEGTTEAPTETPTEAPTETSAETQASGDENGDAGRSSHTGRLCWLWWIVIVGMLLIILFLVARRKKEEKEKNSVQ